MKEGTKNEKTEHISTTDEAEDVMAELKRHIREIDELIEKYVRCNPGLKRINPSSSVMAID